MANSFLPSAETDPAQIAGILSFEQAGRALNTNSLGAMRLVARGHIRTIFVGGLQRRIAADELRRYVNDGAFDLGSEKPNDGRWFIEGYDADQFAEQLAAIGKRDVPSSQSELQRLVGDKLNGVPSDHAIEMRLGINDAMKKLICAPTSNPLCASAGERFAASRLRRMTKDVINGNGGFVAKPIEELFASAENYQRYTSAALAELRKRPAVSFTQFVVMPNTPVGRPAALSWVLSMGSILDILPGDLIARAF